MTTLGDVVEGALDDKAEHHVPTVESDHAIEGEFADYADQGAVADRDARFIAAEARHHRFLKQREIDSFCAHGVKASTLCTPWPIVADEVVFIGDGLFDFPRYCHGLEALKVNAFILRVYDGLGLIDLVAWSPVSNRIATWLGHGFCIDEWRVTESVVRIFPDVLSWLRGARGGIVVVKPEEVRHRLFNRDVVVEDDNLVATLEDWLRIGWPRITVAQPAPKLEVKDSGAECEDGAVLPKNRAVDTDAEEASHTSMRNNQREHVTCSPDS